MTKHVKRKPLLTLIVDAVRPYSSVNSPITFSLSVSTPWWNVDTQKLAVEEESNSRTWKEQCTSLKNGSEYRYFVKGAELHTKKRANDISNNWISQEKRKTSFYVSSKGYHVTVAVYPNGNSNSKDTHIPVFVKFLEGKYNSELKWPFIRKATSPG